MRGLLTNTRAIALVLAITLPAWCSPLLRLSKNETLETQGMSVLLFHNAYHRVFGDQKMSGVELILHDQRIATNGDVRLSSVPEQWDAIPNFKQRKRSPSGDEISALCSYDDLDMSYRIDVRPEEGGFRLAVQLDRPLPAALVGKAGLNLEFLPTAYFGKSYALEDGSGIFPRHDDGPMKKETDGSIEPLPLASSRRIVLSPEDPMTRVAMTSDSGEIMLFDGRSKAQNGWFVVRTLLPADKTGDVVIWHVRPNVIAGWTRPPVVGYNQVGYTTRREKVAVLELDPLYTAPGTARVLQIAPEGDYREVFRGEIRPWGKWLRYQYATFDFSAVRQPGVYVIEYAGQRTGPFRIADNVYDGIWRLSLDTYLAEQMDHVKVREGYRIWHGISHLDDARQAPVNYTHFDGYRQGATTDSPFSPGQHIPGLDVGGWFDAGDFDLRTQTQTRVIMDLALAREKFGIGSDDTAIDEEARYVQLRTPDGVPDVLQQIRHGVLFLLAQYQAIGHAIPGIVEPTLEQYTHLGDAASKTDGKIYSPALGERQADGITSGIPDDRWAFTTHTTALNYDAVGALAAAAGAFRGFDEKMAEECLRTAIRVWDEEQQRPPAIFEYFNTTGGNVENAEVEAAVELLIATRGGDPYRKRLQELLPIISKNFAMLGAVAARAVPFMDKDFTRSLADVLTAYKPKLDSMLAENPYGVPIATGTWGGSGGVTRFASNMYFLHEAFPETIGPEYTLHALDYVLGRHPVSNVSYVSGVGSRSKLIAYGNNRADYTFIPGGMVPGVVIIQPDFPELKDDWPYLWYENEYVVDAATSFIVAANAAAAETESSDSGGPRGGGREIHHQ
jgi:endoglucanase